MADINGVEVYEYNGLGLVIEPESETAITFIPSPPTQVVTKINPRPVIIYVTNGKITADYEKLDELKASCKENKLVLVCPYATGEDELVDTYKYVSSNAKKMNIKLKELSVKADKDYIEDAQVLVDYLIDEYDLELDDAEEF